MLEDVTYQMTKMSEEEIHQYLAGYVVLNSTNHITHSLTHLHSRNMNRTIALLKYRQTRASTLVSDNACQIFGGRALTQSGMGSVIEKFQKSFKFQAILGGSEEIMADFAIRQADKRAKRAGISRL